MNTSSRSRQLLLALASAALMTHSAHAQASTFTGRVLTDSGVALAGAEVVVNRVNRSARSDANGEFRLTRIPAGEHIVYVRMPGFSPKVDTIEVADAGDVRREFTLARLETAILPVVPVTATLLDRKLAEFHSRRRFGMGRFLDSAEFAKAHGTRTGDKLRRLPGLKVMSGRFSEAIVASSRGGGRCSAAVWLDGINVGTGFNVNSLDPGEIAAVEWYAGQATVPVQFSAPPRRGQAQWCGVLVIWTR